MKHSRLIGVRSLACTLFLVPVVWTLYSELGQSAPFSEPVDWLGILLPVVFGAIVLPVVWVLTRRAHHDWQFRDAPHALAALVSAQATGVSGSGTEQFELHVEVHPDGAPVFQASMVEFVNLGDLPLLAPGADLEVAYLPDGRIKLRRILPPARLRAASTPAEPSRDHSKGDAQ